ncbi:MAG: hypothetical protein ACOYNN_13720 [Terrimicrobiaceae bacterium]
MLAINAKRGVESTLERVFKNAGGRFDRLNFVWSGTTAGIIFERGQHGVDAKILFPAINEASDIPRAKFNNLIGYALHELGHAWFTDNDPWDDARREHGGFVANLINGLEDPRIELKVIESGYAPNSRALFEDLTNSVLAKNGYVEADDLKNVPFLLAIEGRRLNGYHINVPSIIDDAPWASDLHWALGEAQLATNTQRIAEIAIELYKRLQQDEEGGGGKGDKPTDEPEGEEGEEGDGGEGDTQGDKPTDDGEGGEGGEGGDQGGDQGGDEGGDKPTDKPSDKPSDKPTKGRGKSDFEGGRDPEPSDFIEGELADSDVQSGGDIPNVAKPKFAKFTWR